MAGEEYLLVLGWYTIYGAPPKHGVPVWCSIVIFPSSSDRRRPAAMHPTSQQPVFRSSPLTADDSTPVRLHQRTDGEQPQPIRIRPIFPNADPPDAHDQRPPSPLPPPAPSPNPSPDPAFDPAIQQATTHPHTSFHLLRARPSSIFPWQINLPRPARRRVTGKQPTPNSRRRPSRGPSQIQQPGSHAPSCSASHEHPSHHPSRPRAMEPDSI
ncbi:hypothetical protein ACLOJK_008637 [Asimina triloba]